MHGSIITTLALCAGLGCAASPAPKIPAPPSPSPSAPAPAAEATNAALPARADLLLVRSENRILLRAFAEPGLARFEQVLASDVLEQLYDPELELLWFSDMSGRLWVRDLRTLDAPAPANVLIASDLPEHQKLSVWVGDRYVEGFGQLGEGSVELSLRWQEEPWFETDAGDRLGQIDGKAWLASERARAARNVPAWAQPDEAGAHVALPAALARCDNPELCGAARPFGPSGWQLVITKTDETHGDFSHYGCLLYDPARQAFTRPEDTRSWAPASDAELDTCGPYQFNAGGNTFLASSRVCRLGADCISLEASAIGWLAPGATVGKQ